MKSLLQRTNWNPCSAEEAFKVIEMVGLSPKYIVLLLAKTGLTDNKGISNGPFIGMHYISETVLLKKS